MTQARILIVEDEGIVAIELRKRLTDMRYQVVGIFSTGEEAVEKASLLMPDLILMDIRLKGQIDGIVAAERIRQSHDIPIIFVTAYADAPTLQRAKITEPHGYVLKPFEERELQIAIDVALYKHQNERKLRQHDRWLAITLGSISDAVISCDAAGVINFVNRAAENLLCIAQNEITGTNVTQRLSFMTEENRTLQANLAQRVLAENQLLPVAPNTLLLCDDGSEIVIEGEGNPIRNDSGQVIGMVLVLRDITQKRKIDLELSKAQRLEALGGLAGGIAHRFNNLLTALISQIASIKLQAKHDEIINPKLAMLETIAWNAASAAQQLLTFAKGGAPIKTLASLPGLLTSAANLALSDGIVRYALNLPAQLWRVEVDASQITQVFVNLLQNAKQAMPNGGIVQISAENLQVDTKSSLILTPGRYVRVSVTDSGIGIPHHLIEKIFDPYFTTRATASGLGLATTYSIIKRHNGYIEVESEVGRGSVFRVFLPAEAADSRTELSKAVTQEMAATSTPGKVLFMDDDEMIRDSILPVLEYWGYKVESAEDGESALRLYQQAMTSGEPFDVVILDLTIPNGMGGKDTIEHLLLLDSQVKAIVSSGYSQDPVMAEFQKFGFRDVLPKPYTLKMLKQKLSNVAASLAH